MSKLATILGHDNLDIDHMLETLHGVLNVQSHDVELLGELAHKTASVKRALKLDHTDTTSYELYVALRGRVVDDNVRIARALDIKHENAVSEATPRIINAVSREYSSVQCFVPKPTALKIILRDIVPKQVMKALHYRSVESMLKHESPSHIIVLARYLEAATWQQAYVSRLAKLHSKDFEMRPLEIVWLDKLALIEPLQHTVHLQHMVLHAKEAGCVAIAPTSQQVVYGYTLRTLVLLEHYVHEVMYMTSYAKTISLLPAFGHQYAGALNNEYEAHVRVSQYPVHWRSMHHAIATSPVQDVLPPHLSIDQWHSSHANDRLRYYNDIVSFWDGYGHLVTIDSEPVSASIIDLAIDASYEKSYENRSLAYARRALEQELFSRYLKEPRVSRLVLHRLNLD
ncbi:MAG: hypothetical protein ABIQ64_01630 [Candidatus Saccharimonadales bacterium]